jgi:hypothetical protein
VVCDYGEGRQLGEFLVFSSALITQHGPVVLRIHFTLAGCLSIIGHSFNLESHSTHPT